MRVGMIGAGWGLVGHLPAWRNLPGVEVTAICTAHEHTAAKAAHDYAIPRAYSDYRAMIEDSGVDIVDVGTRPALRVDMVRHALAAGKHVVNANPFAVTLAQADVLVDEQRKTGVVGLVEAQFQWLPQFAEMKHKIEQGFLGDLFAVSVRCHFPLVVEGAAVFPFVVRPGYSTYTWLGEAGSGASALRNLGGHCLHALVYLFGPIAEVSGKVETFVERWRFPDGEESFPQSADTALLTIEFANGGIGLLNISYVVPGAQGFALEAFGSRGRLRIESDSGFPDAHNTKLYATSPVQPTHEDELATSGGYWRIGERDIISPPGTRAVVPLTRMFHAMVSAIEGDEAPLEPSFGQARHIHAVVEAAERAAESGQVQRIPNADPNSGGRH